MRGPEEGGRRRDGQGGDAFMLKTREAQNEGRDGRILVRQVGPCLPA